MLISRDVCRSESPKAEGGEMLELYTISGVEHSSGKCKHLTACSPSLFVFSSAFQEMKLIHVSFLSIKLS